jgi:hypothetical protein
MHHSSDAAYGAAYRTLLDLLIRGGVPHAHEEARDYLQGLIRDGWCWRKREVPPPRGPGAEPSAEYKAYRQRLHDELVARQAQEQAAGQLTLDQEAPREES